MTSVNLAPGLYPGSPSLRTLLSLKSASGENYQENRENLLTDTSRSMEATPVDRIGGSTTNVSADKKIDRSSDHVSRDDSSFSRRDSSESDQSPGRVSPARSSQSQSKDWSLQHRFPDRSSLHRSSRHRSQDRASRHQSPGRSSRHRSPGRSYRHRSPGWTYRSRSCHRSYSRDRHSSSRRHRSKIMHKYSRSERQRHHRYTSPSSYGSSSRSRYESVSSEWSNSSDRNRHHKRKKSHRRRSVSTYRRHKRHKHSSGSRHRGRARSSSRDSSHKTMSQRSHSKSDREDDLSIIVDKNDFEGESRAGSPRKASFKSLKKKSFDRGTSDSEEEEKATISFAEAIQEVMNLLPPEFCPRKESSKTIQRPRSTLDALTPTEDKNSASLPQSLLIKDVVNVLQSLTDKKVKLEPGWVTNQSLERELGIVMKYYRSHGQLFPTSVPKIDKDASLLDLASSGNVNFPVKSLETMERQARNMVTINSYADLFTAASVKALESDGLDAPMLKRLLSSIVSCLKHSSSMAVILTVELLQARREAAIERSKILTEATKNKLRSVPVFSEFLFGAQVAALQKSNSEYQQQSFIASSVAQSSQASSPRFKILKRPNKSSDHRDSSSSSRPPNRRDRVGPRRGPRRGGSGSHGRGQPTPSRGGASNVTRQ